MTYEHVPGHPVADIYAQADLERQIEEAYADGGLDPEDESLPEIVKSNLRQIWSEEEEEMARELTWQESERQRRRWQARKDALIAAWEPVQRKMRRRVSVARETMKKFSRSPALLDMCMLSGVYSDDLAESHGDAEDVWI